MRVHLSSHVKTAKNLQAKTNEKNYSIEIKLKTLINVAHQCKKLKSSRKNDLKNHKTIYKSICIS